MDFTHASAYRFQTYATTKQHDEPFWNQDYATEGLLMQPMDRYLTGHERVLFPARIHERDPTLLPFPTAPDNPSALNEVGGSLYSMQQRWPSPSDSGLLSSYSGSDWSDNDQSPWSSPTLSDVAYTPEAVYPAHAFYDMGGNSYHKDLESDISAYCVALHEVQQYADAQPDIVAIEDEYHAYGSYAQEGYQPMQIDEQCHNNQLVVPSQPDLDDAPNESCNGKAAAVSTRQRPTSTRTPRSTKSPSKVTKRSRPTKRPSSHKEPSATLDSKSPTSTATPSTGSKFFPCPFATYGCTSTFGSKNEWKRHVSSQHMKLGFWRCNQCAPYGEEGKPNDFNRKDLFIQHVRRMHPSKADASKKGTVKSKTAVRGRKTDEVEAAALCATAEACWKTLRSAPERCGCLFCDANFEGCNAWDERMEHVGRHFEAAKKGAEDAVEVKDWQTDETTEQWLVREDLVTRGKGRLVLADLR